MEASVGTEVSGSTVAAAAVVGRTVALVEDRDRLEHIGSRQKGEVQ